MPKRNYRRNYTSYPIVPTQKKCVLGICDGSGVIENSLVDATLCDCFLQRKQGIKKPIQKTAIEYSCNDN